VHVAKLFDSKFLGLLNKEFPEVRFGVLHLYLPHGPDVETLESINLGHYTPGHERESLFTIDVEEPETLNRLVNVLDKFLGESHG